MNRSGFRPATGIDAAIEAQNAIIQMCASPDQAVALLLKARRTVLSRNQIRYFKPHSKQLAYYEMGKRRVRRAFFGGNRTGKTIAGASEVAFHLTGCYPDWWPGFRFTRPPLVWAASTSLDKTIEGIQTLLLGPVGRLGEGFIPGHRIASTEKMQNFTNGIARAMIHWGEGNALAELRLMSYDQGRKKFETNQVDLIWFDEEPPDDIYIEGTMRLLGSRDAHGNTRVGGRMILTFTPLLGMTKVCKTFLRPNEITDIEGISNGCVIASWQDNDFLIPAEVEELRRSTPPHQLEAREHGRPVLGAGMIYPITESTYSVSPFKIPLDQGWTFAIGLDHGWRHPAGLSFWAKDVNANVSYLYRTWRAAEQKIPVIAAIIKEEWSRIGGWCPVFADPSGKRESQDNGGKSIFALYGDHDIALIEADNQHEAGFQEVFEGLLNGSIRVFEGAPCIHWWEEVRLYHRDEKGRVHKEDDDIMDSSRYAIRHRAQWSTPRHMARYHPRYSTHRPERRSASWKSAR